MTFPRNVKEEFCKKRRAGRTLNELSEEFGISKSTASLWARDVELTEQGTQRINKRVLSAKIRGGKSDAKRRLQEKRCQESSGYTAGLRSRPTIRDAMCIGLYWGDGSRSDGKWKFSNVDRDAVSEMVSWAKRAGYDGEFSAVINAYDDSEYSDSEIADFWNMAGIENITVVRLRSKCKEDKKGRHPFGCCHVRNNGVRSWLFSYYRGQRDKILENHCLSYRQVVTPT